MGAFFGIFCMASGMIAYIAGLIFTPVVIQHFPKANPVVIGWLWIGYFTIVIIPNFFPSLSGVDSSQAHLLGGRKYHMDSLKNIALIIVVSFLIAANPTVVSSILNFTGRVLYNGSVMVVSVVEEAGKKVKEIDAKSMTKAIPTRAPKKVGYKEWLQAEMDKLSTKATPATTPTTPIKK